MNDFFSEQIFGKGFTFANDKNYPVIKINNNYFFYMFYYFFKKIFFKYSYPKQEKQINT